MEGYFYSINKNLFGLSFINDTEEKHDWGDRDKWSHYAFLDKLIGFMRKRGFKIKHDTKVDKLIRKDYWYGRKGDLEFVMHRYPRGFSFEFFQNIVFKNSNGGRYDFDKFEKAPYLIKLLWVNETKKMGEFLESLGIKNDTDIEYKLAEDIIKKYFVDSWHHPQKNMDFNLKDLDGTTCEGSYNNTDRDKRTIYNGQTKYFRDYNGRLMRGNVYHNINNMWWVVVNNTTRRNMADFELFDLTEEDFKVRRKVKDIKPKEYIDKLENIRKISNKELLRELKKRGLKVS